MARINLLPWREELRKQQKQDFLTGIGIAVAATLVILVIVHMYIEGLKDYQNRRNKLLQIEITVLDKKIKEIKEIEDKKNKLLTKIDVIHQLQESRPQIVHLFDELATSTPEGIFLTEFSQSGNGLTLTGKAQSNARVSAYMRSIETSPWLKDPKLTVIKSESQLSDFTLLATQGNREKVDRNGGQ